MNKPQPILLPRIHAFDCSCRSCAALANPPSTRRRRPSLARRLRRAANPGDFVMLLIGAQLGVLLVTVLVIADNWNVIASALAAL